MKFVVITKTVAELESPNSIQQYLPDQYPVEIAEVDAASLGEVEALHPNRTIMPLDIYKGYAQELGALHDEAEATASKPWWHLW